MVETARQKRITGRVMHEYKHGELKSGPGGKAGPVKNRRQAIAIALKESGDSKNESPRKNQRNERKTERKEAEGKTAQQEREGKSRVGARANRESTPAMGGRNARSARQKGRHHAGAPARRPHPPGALRQSAAQGRARPLAHEQGAVGECAGLALTPAIC